ncbi:glucosaminidase domain-containing protein [Bacteroides ovatus]|uniref:glucosaminidase domain-containing protein n=1 Tax=Bacteroides ovatus TaxID=28116 RepID=UPI0032BFAA97
MRKKFIKSSRPTYKKRIKKAQQGMRFVSYNPVSNPTIDYTDITNPINPFSEYNFNTVYDKPEALVVPVRDTNEPDVVANNPIAEPVINKPVASKSVTDKPVTKTANSTWKSPYTNRKQWSTELINAYKKAGITNDNAIRMLLAQDALESSWGKSAQGKYNFGNLTTGSSWKGDYVTGNDKNAKGEAIKQKFRSYNSMDEYAADKVQFLKRLYDFDENDDINKFVAKLTGSNKGKRRYAEATNYAKVLTGVYNGIPKGENGMIIKYQEPAQPINRRDAIRDYRPNIPNRIRRATPAEHIQSMIDIYGQSEQPTVTSDVKSPWQHQQAQEAASKGYDDYMQAKKYEEGLHNLNGILTFTDYATLATGLGSLLSKGASMAGKQVGKQMAKRAVGKEFTRQSKHLATPNNALPNNVGWGPRQSIHVVHDKNSARFPKLYFPERWDAVNEGAPEAGIWYQGKLGNPRTAANHSVPGKAEKAAAARDRFAKRPYRVEGDLELERPIVTVGDVPNRAALERAADKMSADGVVFNNVYDNGYSNNQVIFSLRDDLKNGRVFKKGAKPLEKSQFIDTGTSMNGDLDINKNIQNFVEYLLNPETQQRIASIDAELGTKYGEAAKRFVRRYNNGELLVYPRNKGDIGIYDDIINKSRTVSDDGVLVTKDFDRIAFEILRNDPSHVPGHEAKHGIELLQAALLKDMTPAEYYQYAKTGGPRLQALMKDNIVSEDEFVKRIMKEHPEYNEVSVRNKYKYLTIPSEFNSQLHPLIEFEQRAGKSGVPNFKSVDEIDRLINNNPYVGTSENNGLRNLRLLFNYIIKDKNEFMRRFNKYGFGVVPATTIINNYDNE